MSSISVNAYAEESIVTETLHNINLNRYKTVIEMLKPTLIIDGNQWCYIWGSLPEPSCIVGFGDTPYQALEYFCLDFYANKPKP
jgi:hypothetical protein